MNLNQIRFVCAVAERASFSAAAADCFVTQPTLSNGIAQLETELGERIFTRTTRSVSLTPFGGHILPYLKGVLQAQEVLQQQARSFLSPEQKLIRVGMSPLLNSRLLGVMIEPFRLRHPEVEIILREMNMADLERMLEDGMLDFVFGVEEPRKASRQSIPLYREPLYFLPGQTAPAMGDGRRVRMSDIADRTYVMVPDACGLARTTRSLFRRNRRKLKEYSGEAMSYQVLEEWASLGIGAAILPRSKLTRNNLPSYLIADKSGQDVEITYAATWIRKEWPGKHLADFAEHLRLVAPRIVAGLNTPTAQTVPAKARKPKA